MSQNEEISRVQISDKRESLRYEESSLQEDDVIVQKPHSSTELIRIDSSDDCWSNKYYYLFCNIVIGSGNDLFPISMKLALQLSGGAFMLTLLTVSIIIALPLIYMEMFIGRYTRLTNCQMYRMVPIFFGLSFVIFSINVMYQPVDITSETQILVNFLQLIANPNVNEVCPDNDNGCYDYIKKGKIFNDSCKYGYISIVCEKLGEIRYIMEYKYWNMYKDLTSPKYPYYQMIIGVVFTWILILVFVVKRMQALGWIIHIAFIIHIFILTVIFILALCCKGSMKGLHTLVKMDFDNIKFYHVLLIEWYSLGRLGLILPTGYMTSSAYAKFKTTSLDTDCLIIVLFSLVLTGFYYVIYFSVCGVIAESMGVDLDAIFVPGRGMYLTMVPQFLVQLRLPNIYLIFYYGSLWFIETVKAALYLHMIVLNLYDYFPNLKNFASYIWVTSCLLMCFASIPMCDQKYTLVFIPAMLTLYLTFGLGLFITLEVTMVAYFYGVGRLSNDICFLTGHQPMLYWRTMWYLIPCIGWCNLIVMFMFSHKIRIESENSGRQSNELDWIYGILVFTALGIIGIVSTVMYISFRFGTPNLLLSLLKPQYFWGPPGRETRIKRKIFTPKKYIRSQAIQTRKKGESTYSESARYSGILISQFSKDILGEQATKAEILKDKVFFERMGMLTEQLDYCITGDMFSDEREHASDI